MKKRKNLILSKLIQDGFTNIETQSVLYITDDQLTGVFKIMKDYSLKTYYFDNFAECVVDEIDQFAPPERYFMIDANNC